MNGYEDTECEKYFTPPDKTPQQQIDELVEKVAEDIHWINFEKGGELHTWRLCKQEYYRGKAKQILYNNDLAIINPENDWAVNPYEVKWQKCYGGDIGRYRDLMDGYDRCREHIIILKEME